MSIIDCKHGQSSQWLIGTKTEKSGINDMGKLATMELRAREGIRLPPLIGIHSQVIRNTRDHSCSLMGISDLRNQWLGKASLQIWSRGPENLTRYPMEG